MFYDLVYNAKPHSISPPHECNKFIFYGKNNRNYVVYNSLYCCQQHHKAKKLCIDNKLVEKKKENLLKTKISLLSFHVNWMVQSRNSIQFLINTFGQKASIDIPISTNNIRNKYLEEKLLPDILRRQTRTQRIYRAQFLVAMPSIITVHGAKGKYKCLQNRHAKV